MDKVINQTQFDILLQHGFTAAADERDIPDETGVAWFWCPEVRQFAYKDVAA